MGVKGTTADEATSHWLRTTAGPLDARYYEERWARGQLKMSQLRTAHGEFRGWQIPQHSLLTEVLEQNRQAILDGEFPRSDQIKAGFEPVALIVAQQDGQLHVLDGLKRCFMAIWKQRDEIEGYVFDEDEQFIPD